MPQSSDFTPAEFYQLMHDQWQEELAGKQLPDGTLLPAQLYYRNGQIISMMIIRQFGLGEKYFRLHWLWEE